MLLLHLALAFALVLFLVDLIGAYWSYFHIGTPVANTLFVMAMAGPAAAVLLWVVACVVYVFAERGGWAPLSQAVRGAVMMIIVTALLFTAEAWRTADGPTESGEPVDVFEFLAQHF